MRERRSVTAAPRRPHLIAFIVSFAFFMQMLDGTIIATALPPMPRSFNDTPVNVSIGMTAYLLTLAVFIPISGWMADRFGSPDDLRGGDRHLYGRFDLVRQREQPVACPRRGSFKRSAAR